MELIVGLLALALVYLLTQVLAHRFARQGVPADKQGAAHPPVTVLERFTPQSLAQFDGVQRPSVYLAVKGRVLDVTLGKQFYGPGGPYENFAGRDASRGLAKQSFEEKHVQAPTIAKLDTLADLNDEERRNLDSWSERLGSKYPHVGHLISGANTK